MTSLVSQAQTNYQNAIENYRTAREALRLAEALVEETELQANEAWQVLQNAHEEKR